MTHKASRRCSWDHPRERGENQVNRLTRECSAGRTTDLSTQLIHGPGPPHARAGRTSSGPSARSAAMDDGAITLD